jgi:glycosyltransferase involved in cell wall biosynthesis
MNVSALTVIHNRRNLFAETIDSVLAQSTPVHEFVIIDDGSTDDLKELIDRYNDPRIKYHYVERIGRLPVLRNLALSKASGDVVAFIDSDDLWHADKIKLHLEDLKKNKSDVSFSDCQLFNWQGNIGERVCARMDKSAGLFSELIKKNQSLAFGTNLLFKRSSVGTMFDETLRLGDHDFVTMVCSRYKTSYVDQVLNYIRKHGENTSDGGSWYEIICHLEYNRTLAKLLRERAISAREYRRIKGMNWVKTGYCYMKQKRFLKASKFILNGFILRPKFSYLKLIIKLYALWAVFRIYQRRPAAA